MSITTSADGYRTTPDHDNTGWPPGVPYIVGNEACERFSFYGMKTILQVHLTSLFAAQAYLEVANEASKGDATQIVHLFLAGVYAFPMIGALIADRWAGKFKTILLLSLVYCLGHAVLSVGENSLLGMYVGLALIAVGSGGIKPCVSANVGDQFGRSNVFRIQSVFQIFYFSINFGSFFATLLIPYLRNNAGRILVEGYPDTFGHMNPLHLGTSVAFGLPGVLMFLATVIFWLGRRKFVHVPPQPGGRIGLLDTLCSVSLFMTFGHLFASKQIVGQLAEGNVPLQWGILVAISLGFLALGLYLFALRQRIRPDDGFFAITFHVLAVKLGLAKASDPSRLPAARDIETASRAGVPSDSMKAADPGHLRIGHDASIQPTPMGGGEIRSNVGGFWGPGYTKYGASTDGPIAVFKIISIFFLVSVFWSLFDQHSSTWIRQAQAMDLRLWGDRESFLGIPNFTLDASQTPLMNPALVMLLMWPMNRFYGLVDRMGLKTTPLRRVTLGMFVTSLSFVATAMLHQHIVDSPKGSVWIGWQLVQYTVITIAEVMVSVTGLEFAYTQAPKRMKSTVMGFWLLTVSLGNVLVAFLAGFKELSLVNQFWIYAGLSAGAAVLFALRAAFYTPRDYTQE
jgi:proton-dependent oligopeptide transporter, POT family